MDIRLPEDFIERMKEDLGDEADSFLGSFFDAPRRGIRINPLKTDLKTEQMMTAGLSGIPWEKHGYYYTGSEPGRSALHSAGAYYIQEPSAMAPVNYLDVRPGMCVLDLCAAPGGKSTQIAASLRGRGLLVANEIVSDRARILSQNIERLGIENALAVSHAPEELALRFPAAFDRILVDAPCSGEGMFRKDIKAVQEWSADITGMCAARQKGILDAAASMLKPGGRLVYSTCTFSKAEDEAQAESFLERHKDYHMVPVKLYEGMRCGSISGTVRIMPQDGYGEGHFIAVFEREGGKDGEAGYKGAGEPSLGNKQKQMLLPYSDFLRETLSESGKRERLSESSRLFIFGKNICLMPEGGLPSLSGLKVIRPGLVLGEIRKERFIPSHSLALALKRGETVRSTDLDVNGEEVRKYLNGQSIAKDPASGGAGWTLVTVSGISLGWVKASGSMLKNHYPKGLRINY